MALVIAACVSAFTAVIALGFCVYTKHGRTRHVVSVVAFLLTTALLTSVILTGLDALDDPGITALSRTESHIQIEGFNVTVLGASRTNDDYLIVEVEFEVLANPAPEFSPDGCVLRFDESHMLTLDATEALRNAAFTSGQEVKGSFRTDGPVTTEPVSFQFVCPDFRPVDLRAEHVVPGLGRSRSS